MATKAKTASASRPMTEEADFLQIKSIDHIHFYVGNAIFQMALSQSYKPERFIEAKQLNLRNYCDGLTRKQAMTFNNTLFHKFFAET